jgi:alpha-L-rhamnosidase
MRRIGTTLRVALIACILLQLLGLSTVACAAPAIRVDSTSVEYAHDPIGIDVARPRLSWVLGADIRNQTQSAYEIAVASSPSLLDKPDVWASGKVESNRSVLVPYGGPPLRSRTRYYWAVRVWDAQGRQSAWSAPAWWEMGLLSANDWHAQWIGYDQTIPLPPAFDRPDVPAELPPTQTQGQTFSSASSIKSVAALVPTFMAKHTAVTFSLYQEGPGGRLVAQRRFTDHGDGVLYSLVLDSPAPPGKYYLEESAVDGRVGWYTSNRSNYDFGDAYLNGKRVPGFRMIQVKTEGDGPPVVLASQLRKPFVADKPIRSARLYATALGLYEARINGRRVGSDLLTPGWTNYNDRVQYQTYDVTSLVQRGNNALAVSLAPGWYAGHVGGFGTAQFGLMPAVLMQLEITYADGTVKRIVTDRSWKANAGPLVQADLIMGETYDARRESPGWDLPGFDDSRWTSVRIKRGVGAKLVAQADEPVRMVQEIKPLSVRRTKTGSFVYDLGQNISGVVRVRVSGHAGQTVTISHSEVLTADGSLYTANLRSAKATDTYILKGDPNGETFQPEFTIHGFRYVEVSGLETAPEVTGCAIYTDAPTTLSFSTDVPMLDKLQSNIVWGQRDNSVSIPTDTPARDERLGWTGDIAAFSGTAVYNMRIARFLGSWLTDLREAQLPTGEYPPVAPLGDASNAGKTSPGWGDAGVIVPWVLYEQYGDRRLLEENFDAMTRWIAFLQKDSQGFLRPATGIGDWLNVHDATPKDLIATAYFAHSTAIVAKAARVLGRDPEPYSKLFMQIRDAFDRAYLRPDGRLAGDSQTAYVLALSMDLLPPATRAAAVDRLVELIKGDGWHLSTGFLGTPELLAVLSDNGRADVAYRLLLQTTYPSWGYEIEKGATTIWERWDGIRPDGTFQDPSMNSFNHAALGSVGRWMYLNIAGIRSASPGFQTIVIKPLPAPQIHSANAEYDSAYGPIASHWSRTDGRFTLEVKIPVNTRAEIWVPSTKAGAIDSDGATFVRRSGDYAIYIAGSGAYRFVERQ